MSQVYLARRRRVKRQGLRPLGPLRFIIPGHPPEFAAIAEFFLMHGTQLLTSDRWLDARHAIAHK
jgi:hypothetical protein